MLPTLLKRGSLVGDGLEAIVPIEYIVNWFRERVTKRGIVNRVLILKSETASGKSTVLPSHLYNAHIGSLTRGMIVTQPRVITAIENVTEIRKHNKGYTGRDIGYSTKNDKLRPQTRHGILSATIGTLTAELDSSTDDQIIAKYQYIIIDEAHERSIQLDLTLIALYNLLRRCELRDDCPFVVLASATLDQDVFLRFFDVPESTNFIWCRGASQPIEEKWDWLGDHTTPNYIQSAADIIAHISATDVEAKSDVIVFLPGAAEMTVLRKLLEPLLVGIVRKDADAAFDVITLERVAVTNYTSDNRRLLIPIDDIRVTVEGKSYRPRRRVILATNVAETGLTLGDLKYVIDSGYAREVEYLPLLNASGLLTKPAPQSRIWQRRGRAGRNAPGVFYPLYPRHIYDRLQRVQYPDIVTQSCVDNVIMKLAAEQYKGGVDPASEPFEPGAVHAVQLPMAESIGAAMHILAQTGLMRGRYLTGLGAAAMTMAALPPDHVRCTFAGYYWGISPHDLIVGLAYIRTYTMGVDAIDWCAVWHTAGIVSGGPAECYKMRLLIADSIVDGLALYRALERVSAAGRSVSAWCSECDIDWTQMSAFIDAVDAAIELQVLGGWRVWTGVPSVLDDLTADTVARLKHCVYDGFSHNLCVVEDGRKYRQAGWAKMPVKIPPILAEKDAYARAGEELGVRLSVLPKYVIMFRFVVASNKNGIALTGTHASVLDGYVSPDI